MKRVLALAGGVGGAKLADGLARTVAAEHLLIAVNVGDDFEHLGLPICPDLDTVMYTLAGIANPQLGWGQRDETWHFMAALQNLGGPAWFRLGDSDLATHIMRRQFLADGATLSEATAELCRRLGIGPAIVPASDQPVRTMIRSQGGRLAFQEYFVRLRCEPVVMGFDYSGADQARPAPALAAALAGEISAIVVCPSNPFVSIAPILAVPEIAAALRARRAPAVAVSPIVGGKAIKGPAAKMFAELGRECSAFGVAQFYAGLVDGLVIDNADAGLRASIEALGMACLVCDTVMGDGASRAALAKRTLEFAAGLAAP